MILEYYTYTSGEVVNKAFNALATFLKPIPLAITYRCA